MTTTEVDRDLLIRLDERTKTIQEDVSALRNDLKENYVPKTAFDPVRAVVFGGVGLVLISVLGLLISMAIK